MPRLHSHIMRVALVTAAVGSLAFTTVGVAGATTVKDPSTYGLATFERTFNCADATQRLTHAQRLELGPAAKLTAMIADEAQATQGGHPKHAAVLAKRIAKEQKRVAAGLSARFKTLLNKYTGFIEAKCHVTPPAYVPAPAHAPKATAGTSSTSTSTGSTASTS
jgi:hypothetical protein